MAERGISTALDRENRAKDIKEGETRQIRMVDPWVDGRNLGERGEGKSFYSFFRFRMYSFLFIWPFEDINEDYFLIKTTIKSDN